MDFAVKTDKHARRGRKHKEKNSKDIDYRNEVYTLQTGVKAKEV